MDHDIVVAGTSLGGLMALEVLLAGLSDRFVLPFVVVQHRSAQSGSALAEILRHHSLLPVREPCDKDEIRPRCVYLAPPDYHLLVEPGRFALSTEAPVRFARPSIDVLFETTADAYGSRAIAVVLTGASEDGAEGVRRIKARGGVVLVQEPETSESGVMPRAAMRAAAVDEVLPLERLATRLAQLGAES